MLNKYIEQLITIWRKLSKLTQAAVITTAALFVLLALSSYVFEPTKVVAPAIAKSEAEAKSKVELSSKDQIGQQIIVQRATDSKLLNPFNSKEEIQNIVSGEEKNDITSKNRINKLKDPHRIVLKGIIEGDHRKIALIFTGEKTKSYKIGDKLREFDIEKIGDNYVILVKDSEKITLRLSR